MHGSPTSAGYLFDLMSLRKKMQEDGVTNPSPEIKDATRSLVLKLANVAPDEQVYVSVTDSEVTRHTRYTLASSGELIFEIVENRDT